MMKRISAVIVLSAVSCGPKSVDLDPLTLDVAPRPDSGPVLQRHTGRVSAMREQSITIHAAERFEQDGWTYVRAQPHAAVYGNARLRVLDGERGVAFPCRPGMCLRIHSGRSLPQQIRLDMTVFADLDTWSSPPAGQTRQLIVDRVVEATESPALPHEWLRCAAEALHEYGHRDIVHNDPFFEFARNRLETMAGGGVRNVPQLPTRRTRRTEVGETMALYTGWTSVEEALQTDRGLLLRAAPASQRSVSIETLTGVPLAEHPWSRMISELGRQPAVEPLASYVPNDVIYLHFHDLRSLVLLAKDIDEWASPVVQIVDRKAGATHFAARYEHQLGIERMGFAETLGHVAANGVALVAGDPFLREGTDVSLLFDVRSESLLERALATYEERARERRPDAAVSTYETGGHTVRLFGTTDRAVHQHRVRVDDVLILSNSRRAIERFLAVRRGELTPLAESGDFRYMRTLYPFAEDSEDGFAFAGDALVARVVGPRMKILSGRRMEARADLAAVNYAALLYGWLEAKPATSIDEVIAAGYLARHELIHADGSPISFSPERGASSEWGTVARLKPLLETGISMVTPEEKSAYERFRDTYQRNWTGYIDPIAARIQRDGVHLDIDARMLPLIESSEYDELISMVGKATVTSPPRANGIQWTFAVGQEARLRRTVDGLAQQITRSSDISIGWLGDWVMVGAGDRSGLWDLAQWGAKMPDTRSREAVKEDGAAHMGQVLGRLPLYAGAHVKNRLALAGTLAAIKAFVESAAPGMIEWGPDTAYRDVPVVAVREKALPNETPRFGIVLRYTIAGDVFIASLERETLEAQIDAILDGRFAPKANVTTETDEKAPQAIVSVRTASADSWLVRTAAGMMEQATMSSNRAAFRSIELLQHGRGQLPADMYTTGLGYLGYEPRFANGGTFRLNGDNVIEHSLYGSEVEPKVPEVPVPGAAITRLLESLRLLETALGFEGEKEHRGLHATVRLRRR